MVILYLGTEEDRRAQYMKGLEGYPVREIRQEELKKSPRQLAEEDQAPMQAETGTPQEGRAFLFADLPDLDEPAVRALLEQLEKAGIEKPLMAVRTEHNMDWPLQQLADEIAREEAYFKDREELAALLGTFSQEEMKDPYIGRSVMTAYMMLRARELSEQDLALALQALREIRAGLDKNQQAD